MMSGKIENKDKETKLEDTPRAEKRKRGRPTQEESRDRERLENRKITEMWKNDSEEEEVESSTDSEERTMKKKDQKSTPQNREKKKEQETEEQLDMSQDIVGRIVESLKIEIVQGRELLEKEVRKEMKGLARRIEAMEERWKKKEEEMGKKIEEMLEQMKEVQNKERHRRKEEKEEVVEEVMEKIEEKINERDKRKEEKEMERSKEAWNEVKRIHRKLEERERREKKNKIVIRGLEVPKREAKEKTRQFLMEEFGVKEGIVGIEIIGGGEIAKVSIVEMENWEAKQEVMKKKGKLRGKRIYIDHDMTQEERRVQKLLREKAREEINEGREAKALLEVRKFQIGERVESDHLPAEVDIGKEQSEEIAQDEGTMEYIEWDEKSIEDYRKKCEEHEYRQGTVDEEWEDLQNCIKESMIRKERSWTKNKIGNTKWWDKECTRLKRKVRRTLEEKREKELEEIREAKTDSQIWEYINKQRKKRRGIGAEIKEEEWLDYFMKQLSGSRGRVYGERRKVEEVESEEEITDEEIEGQIAKLKRRKAAGSDRIPAEAWILSEGKARDRIKKVIKRVWKGEGFPKEWRRGVIVPLHKKGDYQKVENYRGITLLNTAYKIYAAVLNERIKKNLEDEQSLDDTQAGFRRHRGVVDNVYILQHVVEKELKRKGGKIFAFFIDLKSAFDKVDRRKVWLAMRERGIREGLIERTKEIYEETRNTIRLENGMTEEFWTEEGVRQGCILSPTLFITFLADLEEELNKAGWGGINIGILNERIKKNLEDEQSLDDTQAGFRRHRGVVDNVYILQHVVEKELKKKG
ncbi:trichohyalin-like, partial [Ceratina calcarata]|uniref:Trichohyalin-like n=1 Tax=Ceratina calcarata TaxID=156304 RepID=A0AAJ7IWV4_9HYME